VGINKDQVEGRIKEAEERLRKCRPRYRQSHHRSEGRDQEKRRRAQAKVGDLTRRFAVGQGRPEGSGAGVRDHR